MNPLQTSLAPRTAFDILIGSGHGLQAKVLDTVALATVLLRKGQRDALAAQCRLHLALELPNGPQRTVGREVALVGTGPGAWLAVRDEGKGDFAPWLKAILGDTVSISDQSDGYAVLRLSGPKVRAILAKMVPIDLHPKVFPVGSAAVTLAGHIGATLWRREDQGGSAVFEIAVARSMASDFGRFLAESGAESKLHVSLERGATG